MSAVLLDTSAYSAFFRGNPELKQELQKADSIALNPVVLGELLAGFRKGARRKDNERDLSQFLSSPRVQVLSIDEETSERYATILDSLWTAGTPIPTNDIWIAASAMQHGLAVLTSDPHYLKVQQVIVRCFGPQT